MTREEIIRMAQEAGPLISTPFDVWCERFAALVAAAERETCAKVCEAQIQEWVHDRPRYTVSECAAAIRARNNE